MGLTKKQLEVIEECRAKKPRVVLLYGAKRSGKTFVNNLLFLAHLSKFKGKNLDFIIAGSTTSAIFRNVISDLERLLGQSLVATKKGYIEIFGNKVQLLSGEKKGSYKKARGFTSYGTYFNEMSTLEKEFVEECFSRTSGEGARIFCDTNTDSPTHYVKTNYVDKSGGLLPSGKLNILAFKWTLYDNTTLSKDYIKSIEDITPSGASYDRHILGEWASKDGLIYKDFTVKNNVKPLKEFKEDISEYILGVDWGFEHYGSIVVVGVSKDKTNLYLVDYVAERQKYYEEYWLKKIIEFTNKYKPKAIYMDSARSEYVSKTQIEIRKYFGRDVKADNANKSVDEGIDNVGSLIKTSRLIIAEEVFKGRLKEEVYSYTWGEDGKPIKTNDDVMDALRYAVFTYLTDKKEKIKVKFGRGFR